MRVRNTRRKQRNRETERERETERQSVSGIFSSTMDEKTIGRALLSLFYFKRSRKNLENVSIGWSLLLKTTTSPIIWTKEAPPRQLPPHAQLNLLPIMMEMLFLKTMVNEISFYSLLYHPP